MYASHSWTNLVWYAYSCIWSFVFNKMYFWTLSQKHWYVYLPCILNYIHMHHASSCFNIMFLYLVEFWTKQFSIWKIKVWKIRDLFFGKISKTQKWFKKFEICVEIFLTCLYFKYNVRTYFLWIFRVFLGFFRILKTQFSSHVVLPARLWRSTGPVDWRA